MDLAAGEDDRRRPGGDRTVRCRHRHRQHLLDPDRHRWPQSVGPAARVPVRHLGFALVEAVALFALLIAFLILFL